MGLANCPRRRAILPALLILAAQAAVAAPAAGSRFLHQPDVGPKAIVFVSGDDLWTVTLAGGRAKRLTSQAGRESHPRFSPDGTKVAYSAQQGGNLDVHVIAAAGGAPRGSPTTRRTNGSRAGRRTAAGCSSAPTARASSTCPASTPSPWAAAILPRYPCTRRFAARSLRTASASPTHRSATRSSPGSAIAGARRRPSGSWTSRATPTSRSLTGTRATRHRCGWAAASISSPIGTTSWPSSPTTWRAVR